MKYLSNGSFDKIQIHLTLIRCSNFSRNKFNSFFEIIFQLNLKKLTVIKLNPFLATKEFYNLISSSKTLRYVKFDSNKTIDTELDMISLDYDAVNNSHMLKQTSSYVRQWVL